MKFGDLEVGDQFEQTEFTTTHGVTTEIWTVTEKYTATRRYNSGKTEEYERVRVVSASGEEATWVADTDLLGTPV